MFKINPLSIFIPRSPINQVFESRDIDFLNKNQDKLKDENFFNIIKSKSLSNIRSKWKSNRLNGNYHYHLNKYYLLDIESEKSFFRGILCGLSSEILKQNLIVPHEKVFNKRVEILKNYLNEVKIQAEPVVFAANFTKGLIDHIKLSISNKPIIKFNYKKKKYTIRAIELSDSINKFSRFYIVDGHHRTESLKLLSEESKKECQLLTFITDISYIKSDKFTWKVSNPSINLINKIKKLESTNLAPSFNSFWVTYQGKKYIFKESDLDKLSIFNLEKWIINSGDKIKRCYYKNIDKKINSLNSIIFNYPSVTFNEVINFTKKNLLFPQKTTFLEPKMLTGLTIYELC